MPIEKAELKANGLSLANEDLDYLFHVVFPAAKVGMEKGGWDSSDREELCHKMLTWIRAFEETGWEWDKFEALVSLFGSP